MAAKIWLVHYYPAMGTLALEIFLPISQTDDHYRAFYHTDKRKLVSNSSKRGGSGSILTLLTFRRFTPLTIHRMTDRRFVYSLSVRPQSSRQRSVDVFGRNIKTRPAFRTIDAFTRRPTIAIGVSIPRFRSRSIFFKIRMMFRRLAIRFGSLEGSGKNVLLV